MLPSDTKGKDWEIGIVWNNYEWPYLGSDVTEVVRINPNNDEKEVIKDDSSTISSTMPITNELSTRHLADVRQRPCSRHHCYVL